MDYQTLDALKGVVRKIELDEAVQKFVNHARQYAKGEPLGKWYAGITTDPDERKSFHKRDKERFDYYAELHTCANKADALEVERALEAKGFSIYRNDLLTAENSAIMESKENFENEKHIVYTFLGAY